MERSYGSFPAKQHHANAGDIEIPRGPIFHADRYAHKRRTR
jgi:hypothetical protein